MNFKGLRRLHNTASSTQQHKERLHMQTASRCSLWSNICWETMENSRSTPIWNISDGSSMTTHLNSKQTQLRSQPVGGAKQDQSASDNESSELDNGQLQQSTIASLYHILPPGHPAPLIQPPLQRGRAREWADRQTDRRTGWATVHGTRRDWLTVNSARPPTPQLHQLRNELRRDQKFQRNSRPLDHTAGVGETNKNTNSVTWLY